MVPDEPVLTATAGYQQIHGRVARGDRRRTLRALGLGRRLDSASRRRVCSADSHLPRAYRPDHWQDLLLPGPRRRFRRRHERLVRTGSYEYRHAASGETLPTTWTNVGNVLTVNVTELTNGTTYNFELRAVSDTAAAGGTARATRKAASVPGAPTLTAAALNYGRIELSWTAPAENGGDDIDSYRIEIVNSQGVWVTEATLPSSRTTYTDSGLTRATEYLYRIHARNAAGEGPAGSASAVTLANLPGVPAAPVVV